MAYFDWTWRPFENQVFKFASRQIIPLIHGQMRRLLFLLYQMRALSKYLEISCIILLIEKSILISGH